MPAEKKGSSTVRHVDGTTKLKGFTLRSGSTKVDSQKSAMVKRAFASASEKTGVFKGKHAK